MANPIKCLLLDVDNVIISEVEEMGAEIGDPDCKLIKPYLFAVSYTHLTLPTICSV